LAASIDKAQEAERRNIELAAIRDQLLADRANESSQVGDLPVLTRTLKSKPASRKPIAIPGGLVGNTAAATLHLVRTVGVEVVVDGYNLAKQTWPSLDLLSQRERCIDTLEDLARRYGVSVHVVFDGADVVGATGPRRLIRVLYSPSGVLADDVIRDLVGAFAISTQVVVVTDDQEIVSSVRAMGANVVTCAQIVGVAGR
jgi:YacP-like NYN domain